MSKPFWQRNFPLVYRCKNCGEYHVMKEPEPWGPHLCDYDPDMSVQEMRKCAIGEWEFIAEGDEARELIADIQSNTGKEAEKL